MAGSDLVANLPARDVAPPQEGQAVPAGGAAAGGMAGKDNSTLSGSVDGQEVLMQLMRRAQQPHTQVQSPEVSPKFKAGKLSTNIGLAAVNMFVPFIGGAVQKSVKAERETQIVEVMNKLGVVSSELEMAQYVSQGDPKKMEEYLNQSPKLNALFNGPEGKKFRKGMMKVFGTDLLNPEKQNTVYHEAMKRQVGVAGAVNKIKELFANKPQQQGGGQPAQGGMQPGPQGNMGQPTGAKPSGQTMPQPTGAQPNGQAMGQPQQKSNAEMVGGLPQHITPPDLKSAAQILESMANLSERHQAHLDSLAVQKENLDVHRESIEQMHQDRMSALEARRDHDKDMEGFRRDSLEERKRYDREQTATRRAQQDLTREMAYARMDLQRDLFEMRQKDKHGLKPEYKAGLNTVTVSMFGSKDGSSKGEIDKLAVFDNPDSRKRLAAAVDLYGAQDEGHHWLPFSSQISAMKKMAEAKLLTPEEREWVRFHNRTVSAINALRSVTGLPRATQQLMERYILELPNPSVDQNSQEAMEKFQLVQREIQAALEGADSDSESPDNSKDSWNPEAAGGKKVVKP